MNNLRVWMTRESRRRSPSESEKAQSVEGVIRPTGAIRMTAPQPLLSFRAGVPNIVAALSAEWKVCPGARRDHSGRTFAKPPVQGSSQFSCVDFRAWVCSHRR